MTMKRWLRLGLVLTTLLGSLTIIGSANAQAATCQGYTVTVDIGAGQTPTNGPDVILGTNGADVIDGKDGNDRICGLAGNDTIRGGTGNDVITGGGGADTLYGQGGRDLLRGQSGVDQLLGGNGNDRLYGGDAGDTLNGEAGDDTIWGDAGNDTITGDAGNDRIFGGGGADTINGGDGNDELNGQAGDDSLLGGAGADTANGGGGEDDCTAEAETDCEDLVLPPEWIAGTEMNLDSMGMFDFTVSWCCVAGGPAMPDFFELVITDSAGATQLEFIDPVLAYHFTVSEFGGYALQPNESYTLEVVAVNEAGRSETLAIHSLSQLKYESDAEIRSPGMAASAESRGSADSQIRVYSEYTPGPCALMRSTLKVKHDKFLAVDDKVSFEALSDVCTDGNVITRNVATRSCILTRGGATIASDLTQTPASQTPNTDRVFNAFGCAMASSSENSFEISLVKGVGSVTYTTTDTVEIRTFMSITHEVRQWGAGLCFTATTQPAEGGSIGSCEAGPVPTG